jgi:N-acetylmuramoyl-L-alanine amidase
MTKRVNTLLLAVFLCAAAVMTAACGTGSRTENSASAGSTGEAAAAGTTEGAAPAGQTAAAAVTGETAAAATTESAAAATSASPDLKPEGNGFLVVIDAGHQQQGNSGQEPIGPGASSTKAKVSSGTAGVSTGVPEYQLNLDITLQLRDELIARGYDVILCRETNDVDISNSERAAVANENEADAFIRIHANGSGSSSAHGSMTICMTPGNPFNGDLYEESRHLSDCVLDAYVAETGISKEYVWETDTMSGINWSQVPVTILEMGYMSNPSEDEKMQDPDFQKVMVTGIANGIDDYFEVRKGMTETAGDDMTAAQAATETSAALSTTGAAASDSRTGSTAGETGTERTTD